MIDKKIEKLKQDVEWFYGEDFKLNEAVEKYEAAIKLAKEIEKDLQTMKNKIIQIGAETEDQN